MNKTLFVVATPIGNLDDISKRAIDTLRSADYILAEDTRRTHILVEKYNINTRIISLHKFNEYEKLEEVKKLFENFQNIALVSDAGTPLISDPGAIIVDYALNNHIKVVPIPGASALSSILSVCGFTLSEQQVITFIGFLPPTGAAKKKVLLEYLSKSQTIVFFESPNRVVKTLKLISELSPNSSVVLGRELTKVYEEVIHFEAHAYPQDLKEKGEFVIAVAPPKNTNKNNMVDISEEGKNEPRKIAAIIGNYLNIKQKDAYDLLVKLKNETKT